MGLDNFAVYGSEHPKYDHINNNNNDIPNHLFFENKLCAGLWSNSHNAFRGKFYNDVVQFFTGHSLYSDILIPEDVTEIYNILNLVTEYRFNNEFLNSSSNTYKLTYQQLKDFNKWLSVIVSEKGSIISWY